MTNKSCEFKIIQLPQRERIIWLNLLDALIACSAVKPKDFVMEIGVYKGGWALTVLINEPTVFVVGIDPYPGLNEVKLELENYIKVNKLTEKFKLYDSHENFLKLENHKSKFQIIHIDGEHTETAVFRDLMFASEKLSESGIIIVDDFFDKRFPGVTFAVQEFMNNYNFRIFMITEKKVYICRERFHKENFELFENLLTNNQIQFSRGFRTGSFGESYVQSNAVLGYDNLLIRDIDNKEILWKLSSKSKYIYHFKQQLKYVIPPFLPIIIRKLLR